MHALRVCVCLRAMQCAPIVKIVFQLCMQQANWDSELRPGRVHVYSLTIPLLSDFRMEPKANQYSCLPNRKVNNNIISCFFSFPFRYSKSHTWTIIARVHIFIFLYYICYICLFSVWFFFFRFIFSRLVSKRVIQIQRHTHTHTKRTTEEQI